MNRDELLKLRLEIVNRTKNIVLEGTLDPLEKVNVIMSLIGAGDNSLSLLQKAYELSNQLEDDSSRLDVLLDLIYAIDGQLAGPDSSPAIQSEQVSEANQTQ